MLKLLPTVSTLLLVTLSAILIQQPLPTAAISVASGGLPSYEFNIELSIGNHEQQLSPIEQGDTLQIDASVAPSKNGGNKTRGYYVWGYINGSQ